jgi:hypothetical protein
MKNLVEIVWDNSKKKYRAKLVGKDGWVRFPNNLRIPGAVYHVEKLTEVKAGSWIATGNIKLIKVVPQAITYIEAA